MNKYFSLLKGRRTYIVAVLLGLVVIAESLGYLDAETAFTLKGLLGAGGLAALRAGVK